MLRIHDCDPSPLLEAAFARIEREQMAGVPILNPALRVQAVDFTRWQGQWLGALVTPWFLNLVLVGVEPESLELGLELTPTVAAQVPRMVALAVQHLRQRGVDLRAVELLVA